MFGKDSVSYIVLGFMPDAYMYYVISSVSMYMLMPLCVRYMSLDIHKYNAPNSKNRLLLNMGRYYYKQNQDHCT